MRSCTISIWSLKSSISINKSPLRCRLRSCRRSLRTFRLISSISLNTVREGSSMNWSSICSREYMSLTWQSWAMERNSAKSTLSRRGLSRCSISSWSKTSCCYLHTPFLATIRSYVILNPTFASELQSIVLRPDLCVLTGKFSLTYAIYSLWPRRTWRTADSKRDSTIWRPWSVWTMARKNIRKLCREARS